MWLNATEPDCVKFSAENNGWILDGFLKPTWFVGDSTPTQVESVLCNSTQNHTDNEDDSDICDDESDSCDESESSEESNFE